MYPWQVSQWQQIMQRTSLPHALLLRGHAGNGKVDFAHALSRSLLCAQPVNTHACNICAGCTWFNEGAHPDFKMISPEDNDNDDESIDLSKKKTSKKSQISVSQIRQLSDYLHLSNHQTNGRRIVLIAPAELLNIASSNALLKMLEEPPANTIFLLVSSQPQRLLPTIMSRCQVIEMPIPNSSVALDWLTKQGLKDAKKLLEYAGGAPLLAVQMSQENGAVEKIINHLALGAKLEPLLTATAMLQIGMERSIETLQKWIFDLTICIHAQKIHYHVAHTKPLQLLCKSVNLKSLLSFQQKLLEYKKTANHPLSNEMQLENILLNYTKIFSKKIE